MTRPFDITNTNDALTLDASGRGKQLFTVTNTTQKPLRGILRVRGLDSAQAGWFAVVGDGERDFPAGVGHQVEVEVKVPPGTPPAKFRMRLDALSVANPDDDFTEGPVVALTIPTVEVKKPTDMPWWVWLLIALVLLVVIGVVLYLVVKPSKPKPLLVPQVVGQPFESAKTQLESAGIQVRRADQTISDDCAGKVISTQPAEGQSVAASAPVTLNVGMLPYGPATCRQGFVWREGFAGDSVCVTPQVRAQVALDNQLAPTRRSPNGGSYGPDTCLQGFVWRDGRQGDHVCVPVATRQAAANDNAQADERRACRR